MVCSAADGRACLGEPPGEGPEEVQVIWASPAHPSPLSGCLSGVMAGFNMGGDLREPAASIPLGSLAAVGIS